MARLSSNLQFVPTPDPVGHAVASWFGIDPDAYPEHVRAVIQTHAYAAQLLAQAAPRLIGQPHQLVQALTDAVAPLISEAEYLPDDERAAFFAGPNIRIADTCAGEGVLLGILGDALGVPLTNRYANEFHDERHKKCHDVAGNVTFCDTLKHLRAAIAMFQFVWSNPPFDNEAQVEGGGRLEIKFFQRIVEEGHWIQPGGYHAMMAPLDVMRRRAAVNHLARWYDIDFNHDLQAITVIDPAWQPFGGPVADDRFAAVIIGRVRGQARVGAEHLKEAQRINAILTGDLPVLREREIPVYTIPAALPIKKLEWRNAAKGTPTMAMHDVATTGGAYTSAKYLHDRASMRRVTLPPLFPLHPMQALHRVADGQINGATVQLGFEEAVIKGSTINELTKWTETKESDTSRVETQHCVVRRVPLVVTVSRRNPDANQPGGKIRRFFGDEGMRSLTSIPGVTDVLLNAVADSAPPMFDPNNADPQVMAVLGRIKSASGRALPGQPVGLMMMQKLVVAGIIQAQRLGMRGTFLAGEMGTGVRQAKLLM